MATRALILESDKEFATRLARSVHETGPFVVTAVSSLKEACLLLAQKTQDVAFLPVTEDDRHVRALRALQPDLRLILVMPSAEYDVPSVYAGKVQGVLIKSHLDVDLPAVLAQALDRPIQVEEESADDARFMAAPDALVLTAALQQVDLGNMVQTIVLAEGSRLLSHGGEFSVAEVVAVALHVNKSWPEAVPGARVQFMHLPARAGDILLYTRTVNGRYLLTLAAVPETPLHELRCLADALVTTLAQILAGELSAVADLQGRVAEEQERRKAYAIVWRPLQPLSLALHIPLRRAIERLATANACMLIHVSVQPDLVHLVVVCPPGRDSVWASYLFKNGSEAVIQQEYGISASLWDVGFYATESASPLSEAELNLFLERDQSTLS